MEKKIYHILHVDRLASVISDGALLCDAEVMRRQKQNKSTIIGMDKIKQRRLTELTITCYPDLYIGKCVPFYFCYRSVMLYMIYKNNHPELIYNGGQEPIIHLEANINNVVNWAAQNNKRWAFSLSNAGAYYAEFRNDLNKLNELNWDIINSNDWKDTKDEKQAEFLIENNLPWKLIQKIGVYSKDTKRKVDDIISNQRVKPPVKIEPSWYY